MISAISFEISWTEADPPVLARARNVGHIKSICVGTLRLLTLPSSPSTESRWCLAIVNQRETLTSLLKRPNPVKPMRD